MAGAQKPELKDLLDGMVDLMDLALDAPADRPPESLEEWSRRMQEEVEVLKRVSRAQAQAVLARMHTLVLTRLTKLLDAEACSPEVTRKVCGDLLAAIERAEQSLRQAEPAAALARLARLAVLNEEAKGGEP